MLSAAASASSSSLNAMSSEQDELTTKDEAGLAKLEEGGREAERGQYQAGAVKRASLLDWRTWSRRMKILASAAVLLLATVVAIAVAVPLSVGKHRARLTASGNGGSGSGSNGNGNGTASSTLQVQPLPSYTANADFAINVGTAPIGVNLSADFAGLSYEKIRMHSGLFTPANTKLVQLFRTLGAGNLRIGANTVDTRRWNATAPINTSPYISPPDVDSFAAFINATRWKVIYGIRMLNNTPEIAVEEAKYAAKALGSSLYGFEIGNEPNAYPKNPQVMYDNFNVTTFIRGHGNFTGWTDFADAIQQALPNAVLTGPAAEGGAVASFTVPFANAEAQDLSMVTHHYYRGPSASPSATLDTLLGDDPWFDNLPLLRRAASSMSGGARIDECNTFSAGGIDGISNAFASTMWSIKFLFTLASQGLAGANFHGGGMNGFYSPIVDNVTSASTSPRPLYQGMLAFNQAAKGQMLASNSSGSASSAYAWPVRDASSGSHRVMLLNLDQSDTVQFTIGWPYSMTGYQAQAMFVQGAATDAKTGITIGGADIADDGTWSPTTAYSVPIDTTARTSVVTLPPFTGAIVEATKSDSSQHRKKSSSS